MARKSTQQATGYDVDRVGIFAELRDRWVQQNEGRSFARCAEFLGIREQHASSYATGRDNRAPPWSVILRLAMSLGVELRITPEGTLITQRRGRRSSNGLMVPHLGAPDARS